MTSLSTVGRLFETSQAGVWLGGLDGKCVEINAAMGDLVGLGRDEILARPILDFLDSESQKTYALEEATRRAGAASSVYEIVLQRADGGRRPCWVNEFAIKDHSGMPIGSVGIWTSKTLPDAGSQQAGSIGPQAGHASQDHSETARVPKLQHALLHEVFRAAKIGTWELNSSENLLWSDEIIELFGLDRATFGGTMGEFYDLVHPDDIERVKRIADFTGSRTAHFKSEYRILRPDGGLRHIRQTAIILRDAAGNPQGFSGVVQDVSEQVQTEAQLRQAQKMETIGQLSGGVAHDFNNILAAIMGAAELLQQGRSYDEGLVDSVIKSAKRGAELTHRLLAFARKQPLSTTQFDVTQLVRGIAPMIDRLIGQDVRLELDLPSEIWPVEADPAPLEEALLNLAVNARDAIEGAGKITISCRNAAALDEAGPNAGYVEVIVSDTGLGMPEAVKAQAIDPFFTTKPVGKGSGLGLSMVDGYVKQSGGQMYIRSAPGQGTQISLLMPRAAQIAAPVAPKFAGIERGAGETVLVVEDNTDLAVLFARQLASLGYHATYAVTHAAALQEAKAAGGFDVVLSDVMLADGERGPAVVEELCAAYPDIAPVFMTGFVSEDEEGRGAFERAGQEYPVLRKPFKIEELAKAMQAATRAKHP